MRPISLKTIFVALTLTSAAPLIGGVLTACSTSPSNQSNSSSTTNATEASAKKDTPPGSSMGNMNQGSGMMNHSMSMDLGPADADYDLRFIDAMMQHHQGAVKMAQDAQQKSKRPEIKKLAGDIITAQEKEINQMKQWRTAWYPRASSTPMAYDAKMGHMMAMTPEQMKSMMMSMDLGSADNQFDLRFINAMIPHHEGALVMAKEAISKSKRPEVMKLSQEIMSSQQKEINSMTQWRKAWYNQ